MANKHFIMRDAETGESIVSGITSAEGARVLRHGCGLAAARTRPRVRIEAMDTDRLPRCPDCGLLGHQHQPDDACRAPMAPRPRARLPKPKRDTGKPVADLAARCSVYVILASKLPRLRASEVLVRAIAGRTAYVTTTAPHRQRWRVDLTAGTAVEVGA